MATETVTSKPPPLAPKRREQNRREFLRTSALAAGAVGLSLLGLLPQLGQAGRLRPPGAIKRVTDEQPFLAACIKCGQCVQVCPVQAIKLADLMDGVGVGAPYIDARAQACDFSCDGLQCVLACPTGALTHEINYPAQARMGFARLARPEACLAVRGQGLKGQARGGAVAGKLRWTAGTQCRWPAIPTICPCATCVSASVPFKFVWPNAPPVSPRPGTRTNARPAPPSPWRP
jgi:ferredoxin-type protein NapG